MVVDATITFHNREKFLGSRDIFLKDLKPKTAILAVLKFAPDSEWTDAHLQIVGESGIHCLIRCRSGAGGMS
jgi:hypothetical protein